MAEAAERSFGGRRPGDCRYYRAREGEAMEGTNLLALNVCLVFVEFLDEIDSHYDCLGT